MGPPVGGPARLPVRGPVLTPGCAWGAFRVAVALGALPGAGASGPVSRGPLGSPLLTGCNTIGREPCTRRLPVPGAATPRVSASLPVSIPTPPVGLRPRAAAPRPRGAVTGPLVLAPSSGHRLLFRIAPGRASQTPRWAGALRVKGCSAAWARTATERTSTQGGGGVSRALTPSLLIHPVPRVGPPTVGSPLARIGAGVRPIAARTGPAFEETRTPISFEVPLKAMAATPSSAGPA